VPTSSVTEPRQAVRKAVSLLADQGIIWKDPVDAPEFADSHFSFGCGANGARAFDMQGDRNATPFQTCFLFGAEWPEVVPQCPGVDPKCPKCGANVSSEFYEFVNDEKVAELFQCRSCGYTCQIDRLADEVGILITTLYVCFDDTDGTQLDGRWLRTFSEQLGISFVVKEYWYT
jgi:hypothetical protein